LSFKRLARPFHQFALSAEKGNALKYAKDLGLEGGLANNLVARLKEVSVKSAEMEARTGKPVTREQLYREFVTLGEPAQSLYDRAKPFSIQIKELIDLRYNANLPDALQMFALTPRGSLARTALQELELASANDTPLAGDELIRLIRNTAFELATNAQYLSSPRWLTLEDVNTVRRTDQWIRYRNALSSLLANPMGFPDDTKGAPAVYKTYIALAARTTSLAKNRVLESRLRNWTPRVEIQIERIGGKSPHSRGHNLNNGNQPMLRPCHHKRLAAPAA
jgi:hypothetical protein